MDQILHNWGNKCHYALRPMYAGKNLKEDKPNFNVEFISFNSSCFVAKNYKSGSKLDFFQISLSKPIGQDFYVDKENGAVHVLTMIKNGRKIMI